MEQPPPPTLPQAQLDVTTSDLLELEEMERDVVNIEQLVNRKHKALDEHSLSTQRSCLLLYKCKPPGQADIQELPEEFSTMSNCEEEIQISSESTNCE